MIAVAAGTDPACVAVQCVHQHTAPLVDMDAQKLLAEIGAPQWQIDPKVFSDIEERWRRPSSSRSGGSNHSIGSGQGRPRSIAWRRTAAP